MEYLELNLALLLGILAGSCLACLLFKNIWTMSSTKEKSLQLAVWTMLLVLLFFVVNMGTMGDLLLPVSGFVAALEAHSDNHNWALFEKGQWNAFGLYNAFATLTVTAVNFLLYTKVGQCAYCWMERRGQLREKPDGTQRRVTFGPLAVPEVASRSRRKCILPLALFAVVALFLPTAFQHTFSFTLFTADQFTLTSDHLLVFTVVFALWKLISFTARSLNNFPAGFPRARFAISQFTFLYGTFLVAVAGLAWSQANDIMMLYVYKLYTLYDSSKVAQVVLVPDANYFTSSAASYMADCTFAMIKPGMAQDEVFRIFHSSIDSFKTIFTDCIELMLFGCMVFVPVVLQCVVGT